MSEPFQLNTVIWDGMDPYSALVFDLGKVVDERWTCDYVDDVLQIKIERRIEMPTPVKIHITKPEDGADG